MTSEELTKLSDKLEQWLSTYEPDDGDEFHDGTMYQAIQSVKHFFADEIYDLEQALQQQPEPVASTAEEKLIVSGVFKGQEGLRGLAESDDFWERQNYGTRLYYGDGIADYLHRDVLREAIRLLDNTAPPSRQISDEDRMVEIKNYCGSCGQFALGSTGCCNKWNELPLVTKAEGESIARAIEAKLEGKQ